MSVQVQSIEPSIESVDVRPEPGFIETPILRELTQRSLMYLEAGFPVHFRGPAGTGKTTLALHVAAQRQRPVMFLTGDDELNSQGLVGGIEGYKYRRVVDRYISSVHKYEENAIKNWVDQRLTIACREGYTLVYDEYTRSRPEANNVLLSVLEEGILVLPDVNQKDAYLKVHPGFRALFTSNPEEYAGVHKSQDALVDRMITLDLDYNDIDTEVEITAFRTNLSFDQARPIVQIVRAFREKGKFDQLPTLRASIMIARVVSMKGRIPSAKDDFFVQICMDVLASKAGIPVNAPGKRGEQLKFLVELIEKFAP